MQDIIDGLQKRELKRTIDVFKDRKIKLDDFVPFITNYKLFESYRRKNFN